MQVDPDALFPQPALHFRIKHVGDQRRQDHDVLRRHALDLDEVRHVIDRLPDHFGIVVAGGKAEGRAGADRKLTAVHLRVRDDPFHGLHRRRADEGFLKLHLHGTDLPQRLRGKRIAAHEAAVAAVPVADQQHGAAQRFDLPDKMMGGRDLFLQVVKDKVQPLFLQPVPENRIRQQPVGEDIQLEGIVQQVVFQAHLPEQPAAFLRLVKHGQDRAVPAPALFHDLRIMLKRDLRSGAFVHRDHHLVEHPGGGGGEPVEIARVPAGLYQLRHDDLGCFDGEEHGVGAFPSAAALVGDQRPEKLEAALDKAVVSGDLRADAFTGKQVLIDPAVIPSGGEDQHLRPGAAVFHQEAHPFRGSRGLPAPRFPRKPDAGGGR